MVLEEYYFDGKNFLSISHETKQFTFRKVKDEKDCVLITPEQMKKLKHDYFSDDNYRLQWGKIDRLIFVGCNYYTSAELECEKIRKNRNYTDAENY